MSPPPPLPGVPPLAAPVVAFSPRSPPQLSRPLSRTSTNYDHAGGAPVASAYDLPSSSSLASVQRPGYAGGEGLGKRGTGRSARGVSVVTREGRIEEGEGEGEEREGGVEEEERAVGGDGEAVEETKDRAQAMYDRFTKKEKERAVAIVSFAALLAPFASSSFLPSIPQISADLSTTAKLLNITVAIYILTIGIFPLLWAPYAGLYGRRPIYLASLPIFVLGSMGVALSASLATLIVTRIIQAIGSCAVLSVGAGTIGDLYQREQRGTAMGYFYLGILVGPATAPAIAGILTEYAPPAGEGWRAMQWLLMAMGAVAFFLVLLFLPETAHVLGIEVYRHDRLSARAEKECVSYDEMEEREAEVRNGMGRLTKFYCDLTWVWLNPLAPIRLLMHPNILAMSLTSSFVLLSTYAVLVPLSSTVAPRYNITNSAILGTFYLAQGLGNVVSSKFSGAFADATLAKWKKRRNGLYVPEDRLRAVLWGAGLFLPGSVLALGWVLERVGGKVGLGLTVVLLFLDGMALMTVLAPLNTHIVDLFPLRASEAIACNNALRYIFSAAASAFVLPMIQAIGVGWTNTFAAALIFVGFLIVLSTIRWGRRMREKGAEWGLVAAGMEEEEQGDGVPKTLSTASTVVTPPEVEKGEGKETVGER